MHFKRSPATRARDRAKVPDLTGVGGGMGATVAARFVAEGARVVGCDLDVAAAAPNRR